MKGNKKQDVIVKNVMSSLYWKERKKGLNHYKAFRMVGKKAIGLKIKNPYGNADGDNKVNKYDCEPKNRRKQDNEDLDITEEDMYNAKENITQLNNELSNRERDFLEEHPELLDKYNSGDSRAVAYIKKNIKESIMEEDMENQYAGPVIKKIETDKSWGDKEEDIIGQKAYDRKRILNEIAIKTKAKEENERVRTRNNEMKIMEHYEQEMKKLKALGTPKALKEYGELSLARAKRLKEQRDWDNQQTVGEDTQVYNWGDKRDKRWWQMQNG